MFEAFIGLAGPLLIKWAQESNPVKFVESIILLMVAFLFLTPVLFWATRKLAKRLDAFQGSVISIEDTFKTHLTNVEQKFDNVHRSIGEIKTAITAMDKNLAAIEFNHARELRDQSKKIDGLDKRVKSIEDKTTKH